MIQFLLMLFSLAGGNHTGYIAGYSISNNGEIQITNTIAESETVDDGTGGPHGPILGNSGQTPP